MPPTQPVTIRTPKANPVVPCADNDLCTTEVCDPALVQGVRTGLCTFPPVVCNDNNLCTTDTCDPAIGCVFGEVAPCNDNDACTIDTCDPAVGCTFSARPPCNDGIHSFYLELQQ